MIKNTFGESLVGIIIGVFILSFIILGVTNMLINSKMMIDSYENKKTINILKNNTGKIITKIDTEGIREKELFYIRKDEVNKEFSILTGAINADYKYIDVNGSNIADVNTYNGAIFSRILWLERDDNSIGDSHQIIKVAIKRLIKK